MSRSADEAVERLEVPLVFDVKGGRLRTPMVDAMIEGVPTRLIVDTGATTQVLTIDMADRARLTRTPGESGFDVSGGAVASWDVSALAIAVQGSTFNAAHAAAIADPGPFKEWNIGGFLSPQALWPDRIVALDFVQQRLIVQGGSAQAVPGEPTDLDVDHIVVCGTHQAAGTVGAEVAVRGHEPVVAFFDSGAERSEVSSRAVAGASGTTGVSGFSVSGTAVETFDLHDEGLVAGGAELPVKSLAVRDRLPVPEGAPPEEEPDALIGMDVLDGTVLVIAPREVGSIRWLIPRDRSST